MARKLRVLELVPRPELDQLEAFAREKSRTVDEIHDWLLSRGYTMARNAAWNWKTIFEAEDATRRASEISTAYLEAAGQTDQTSVARAALRKFQELVLDYTMSATDADAGELMKLAGAMKMGMNTQQIIVELQEKQTEAVKAAEQQVKTGTSAGDVVATIKKALGITV